MRSNKYIKLTRDKTTKALISCVDKQAGLRIKKKTPFCGFPWVVISTGPGGGGYDMCVYFMTGAHEGSPKVVLEKPGIEPATLGLQDIGLSPTPRRLATKSGFLLSMPNYFKTWHINNILLTF